MEQQSSMRPSIYIIILDLHYYPRPSILSADPPRPQNNGAVSDRQFRALVRVGMFLITAKHDHVARREFVFFARNHQFHLTRLAGQILSRPQSMRNPDHL